MAMKAAVLVEANYEDQEFWYPTLRLREAGYEVDIVAPEKREYPSKHGYPAKATIKASEAVKMDYDLVVIPGGYAPDKMRRHDDMVSIVRKAAIEGRTIASICHGGSMLVSAAVATGRRVTGARAIRDDLIAAGARWVEERVVRDGNFVSAQGPTDLPEFMRLVLAVVTQQTLVAAETGLTA